MFWVDNLALLGKSKYPSTGSIDSIILRLFKGTMNPKTFGALALRYRTRLRCSDCPNSFAWYLVSNTPTSKNASRKCKACVAEIFQDIRKDPMSLVRTLVVDARPWSPPWVVLCASTNPTSVAEFRFPLCRSWQWGMIAKLRPMAPASRHTIGSTPSCALPQALRPWRGLDMEFQPTRDLKIWNIYLWGPKTLVATSVTKPAASRKSKAGSPFHQTSISLA